MADQTALDAWNLAESVAGLIRDLAAFDAAHFTRHAAALRASSTSPRATAYADTLDLAARLAGQCQPVAAALAAAGQ